jgi:hypothetical protein
MPWQIDRQICPVCGGRHSFWDQQDDAVEGNALYAFTCPIRDRSGGVRFSDSSTVLHSRPRDAVEVRQVFYR